MDAPHGRRYSLAFRQWMQGFGFGSMPDTTRKYVVMLVDNAAAIEAWRAALPQRERDRIGNAQHMVRRWQASVKTDHGKPLAYVRRDAIAAWRKFLSCVAMLPPADQMAMWSMVSQARVSDAERLRLARRLARKHRVTNNGPPAQADGGEPTARLKAAVAALRDAARADPSIDEF